MLEKEELLETLEDAKAELRDWERGYRESPTEYNKGKVEEFKLIVEGLQSAIENYESIIIKSEPAEKTRVRINYRISAKGLFQPDITSEAETVETAIANLDKAKTQLNEWAKKEGLVTE